MKKPIVRILIAAVLGFLLVVSFLGCISVYDPPRRGKVIDAETREPIEDAVVMGYWDIYYLHYWLFPGGPSTYYDARETVTDENGHFTLPGLGLRPFPGDLKSPSVHVAKKQYECLGAAWKSERHLKYPSGSVLKEKFEWKDGRLNIYLQKLDPCTSKRCVGMPWQINKNEFKRFFQETRYVCPKNDEYN